MPTIYTAIFAGYDNLKEPTVITPGWRYICYSDRPISSKTWENRIVPASFGPTRTARFLKLMPHEHIKDERSIWIDGTFRINCNLDKFWNDRFKPPITFLFHPLRNCFYREARACIKNRRDTTNEIRRQAEDYRQLGLPANNGMIASGIILRERTPEVIKFCQRWWEELQKYSKRDQLAFARVAWEMPIYNVTRYDYRKGPDFIYKQHNFRRNYV